MSRSSSTATSTEFIGTPWNVVVRDNWNDPGFWDRHYIAQLEKGDPVWLQRRVHFPVDRLVQRLRDAGELPCPSLRRVLDAGCGMTLLPQILTHWGFQVTALDASPHAIAYTRQVLPDEAEMAACIRIWEDHPSIQHARCLVEDPVRSLEQFRAWVRPGGSLTHVAGDWMGVDLPLGSFHLIHCSGGLRCAPKPYWARSLTRFRELLAPGGLVLLENFNILGIREEAESLFEVCGLAQWSPEVPRDLGGRYILASWPTG
jgi:SAM-dependent methyltransferase